MTDSPYVRKSEEGKRTQKEKRLVNVLDRALCVASSWFGTGCSRVIVP